MFSLVQGILLVMCVISLFCNPNKVNLYVRSVKGV